MKTRKPTGKPSWPILLLAGVEKSGKTYSAAEASASELVGRTFWVGVGEDDPDEYGAIPGADFEIVQHDGTYRGVLGALAECVEQPMTDGKPNLIVVDSAGRLWTLLSDAAQETANERAKRKRKQVPDDGAVISQDLWNIAKQRWQHIMDVLRDHSGPSILTARLSHVSVVNESGDPTGDKVWKVNAEKTLPFDVGAIVEFRAFQEAWLTGVRSLRFKPKPNEYTRLEEFTVDDLWRKLGMANDVGERHHSGAEPQGQTAERDALLAELAEAADAAGVPRQQIADEWAADHDGEFLSNATDIGLLEILRDDLRAKADANAPT